MSTKLSAEQLEYWHNSVEGDQDVDDEYETTVGEITALLDHITALESELKAAQTRLAARENELRLKLYGTSQDQINNFRAALVEAMRDAEWWLSLEERESAIQLIQTFELEKV